MNTAYGMFQYWTTELHTQHTLNIILLLKHTLLFALTLSEQTVFRRYSYVNLLNHCVLWPGATKLVRPCDISTMLTVKD